MAAIRELTTNLAVQYKHFLTAGTKSKVESDNDNVSIAGQDRSVVGIPRIPFVRFTVNEDDDREFDIGVFSTNCT